jgi:hypothetical protein
MSYEGEIARFEEIMNEMWELNEEALQIVRNVGDSRSRIYNASRSYWYAHIQGAVNESKSMFVKYSQRIQTAIDMAFILEDMREIGEEE